jgi:hypothetical protein
MDEDPNSQPNIHRNQHKKQTRNSLIYWPLFALLFYLIYGLFSNIPRNQNYSPALYFDAPWRMGQTALQTIWDPNMFHGHLWFNLLITLMIVGCIYYRVPPVKRDAWLEDRSKVKNLFLISTAVCFSIIIAMNITLPAPAYIWKNWSNNSMQYQLPALPALLFGMMVLAAPLKKNQLNAEEIQYRNKSLIGFSIIAIIIGSIMVFNTYWHPHGLFVLIIVLHYFVLTLSVPMMVAVWFVSKITKEAGKRKDVLIYGKKELGLLLFGLLIIVGVDAIPMFIFPSIRGQTFLTIDVIGWWTWAMWPSWVFIVSLSVAFISGSVYYSDKIEAIKSKIRNRIGLSSNRTEKIQNRFKNFDLQKWSIPISVGLIILMFVIFPLIGIRLWWEDEHRPMILINQVGYLPNSPKRVAFQTMNDTAVPDSAPFKVINYDTKEMAFEGMLTKNVSKYGRNYMLGHFDSLKTEGRYYIETEIYGTKYKSYDFRIAADVYDLPRLRGVDFFYYQRSGYDIQEIVPGYPGSKAGNLDDALIYNGTDENGNIKWVWKNTTGGWHDAGDYNKYNGWFQTQWYCTQALSTAWILNNNSFWNTGPQRIDSSAPDILDEMLWGAAFMIKSTDTTDIRGTGKKGFVFENLGGYFHHEKKVAFMSYWGPPEYYTSPEVDGDERVYIPGAPYVYWEPGGSNEGIPYGCVGHARGFQFAGTLLQVARVLENYQAIHPEYTPPAWGDGWNLTPSYLREVAYNINDSYAPLMKWTPENVGTELGIGMILFYREHGYLTGNWTEMQAWINGTLANENHMASYWMHDYLLALILSTYLEFGLPIPSQVMDFAIKKQTEYYAKYYPTDDPFVVKKFDDYKTGQLHLFRQGGWNHIPPDEGQTDQLLSVYLQTILSHILPAQQRLDIIQGEIDWLFGFNPLGLSLMSGVGHKNVPIIHNRRQWYDYPSGHVPGGIINGIKKATPGTDYYKSDWKALNSTEKWKFGDDLPQVDTWEPSRLFYDIVSSGSQEIWIPHNAAWILFIENLNKYALI